MITKSLQNKYLLTVIASINLLVFVILFKVFLFSNMIAVESVRFTPAKEYRTSPTTSYTQVHNQLVMQPARLTQNLVLHGPSVQKTVAQEPIIEIDISEQSEQLDPVLPRSLITYTITVTNRSSVPVTNFLYKSDSWTNETPIIMSSVAITPYPSSILISGTSGVLTKAQVALHALTHTLSSDVDIFVQGPDGQGTTLLSDVGDIWPMNAAMLVFSDSEFRQLPEYEAISSGAYLPTNYELPDTFPAPGPGVLAQYDSGLSTFEGRGGNGEWQLFVVDDFTPNEVGALLAGWTLTLTTAVSIPNAITVQMTIPVEAQFIAVTGRSWFFSQEDNSINATRPTFEALETSLITVTIQAPATPQLLLFPIRTLLFDNLDIPNNAAIETTLVAQPSIYTIYLPLVQH